MSKFKVEMKGVGAGSASIGKGKAPQEERDLIKRRETVRKNVIEWIKSRKNHDLVAEAKSKTKGEFINYCNDKLNAYNPALQAIGKHFGLNEYGGNRMTLCGNLYERLKDKAARDAVRGITADRFSAINIIPSISSTKKTPGREKGTRKLKAGLEHTEVTEENFEALKKRARSMSRQDFVADCEERNAKRLPFIKEAIKHFSGGELGGFPAQYGPGGAGAHFKLYCGLFHDRVHGRDTEGAKSLSDLKAKVEKKSSKGTKKSNKGGKKTESKRSTKTKAEEPEDVTPTPKRYESESEDEDEGLELNEDIYEDESEDETPPPPPKKKAGAGSAGSAGSGSRQSRFKAILDEDSE